MSFLHGSTVRLRKALFSFAALVSLFPAAVSAQTVTAPSGAVAVPTSGDFFSAAFQDAADMKDRSDVGWFAYGIDQPRANLSGTTVAGGVFSATASSNDPNIYLLETGNPVSVPRGRRETCGQSAPTGIARWRFGCASAERKVRARPTAS